MPKSRFRASAPLRKIYLSDQSEKMSNNVTASDRRTKWVVGKYIADDMHRYAYMDVR